MGRVIAGAVILFIMLLLMTSVKVRFEFSDGLRLRISWYFWTIFGIPAKTKKRKRRNKKVKREADTAAKKTAEAEGKTVPEASESAEVSDKKPEKKPDKRAEKKAAKPKKSGKKTDKLTLTDILELVKLVRNSLSTPLRRLLKATRIYGFRLYVVCGGDDAAKAALNYGRTSAAAGAAAAFLDGCFTMKKPEYSVNVDFMSEETSAECFFTAKLTVIAALAFLFWVVGRAVRNYFNRKETQTAVGKLRK